MKPHRSWNTKDPTLDVNGFKLKHKNPLVLHKRIDPLPDGPWLEKRLDLGGTIEDIFAAEHTTKVVDGVRVAAVVLTVIVVFSEEAAEMVSDGIKVIVWRNPKRPATYKASYGSA